MRILPTGTVTLLFTDIEGSTRLLEELGDGYASALAEHRRLLRAAFARNGGVEVDTQGEAFFVAFAKASDALAAAGEANAVLEAAGPIRVRIGIYTGEPALTAEGYVGIDVNRAARVAAAGHGGQVVLARDAIVPDAYVSSVLRGLGELAIAAVDFAAADAYLEESLARANGVGDTWGVERAEAAKATLAEARRTPG